MTKHDKLRRFQIRNKVRAPIDTIMKAIKDPTIEESGSYHYDCKVCGKPFGDKLSLYEHYDSEHNKGE